MYCTRWKEILPSSRAKLSVQQMHNTTHKFDSLLPVTLSLLADPVEYWNIDRVFGIARSMVCRIMHETCKTIVKVPVVAVLKK